MFLRLRLLMAATAVLYMGPLLAGLSRQGWAAILPFAGIFVLWLIVLRPRQWPEQWSDWRKPQTVAQVLTQVVVQLILVTLLFAVGRGIGGIAGVEPDMPLILPLALSFLSIPVCRLVWDPWQADEIEDFLDNATKAVKGIGAETKGAEARLDLALAMLRAMPVGLAPAEMAHHFDVIEKTTGPEALWRGVMQAGSHADARTRLVMALVMATDGRRIEILGDGLPTRVLDQLPDDPALVGLYAERAAEVLTADPSLWGEFPTRARLAPRLACLTTGDGQKAAARLMQLYDRIGAAEERAAEQA